MILEFIPLSRKKQSNTGQAQCLLTSVQQGSGVTTIMMKEDNSGEVNLPCIATTSIDTMGVDEDSRGEQGEMGEGGSDSVKQSREVVEEETPSDSSELADGLHNATLMSQQLDEGI